MCVFVRRCACVQLCTHTSSMHTFAHIQYGSYEAANDSHIHIHMQTIRAYSEINNSPFGEMFHWRVSLAYIHTNIHTHIYAFWTTCRRVAHNEWQDEQSLCVRVQHIVDSRTFRQWITFYLDLIWSFFSASIHDMSTTRSFSIHILLSSSFPRIKFYYRMYFSSSHRIPRTHTYILISPPYRMRMCTVYARACFPFIWIHMDANRM